MISLWTYDKHAPVLVDGGKTLRNTNRSRLDRRYWRQVARQGRFFQIGDGRVELFRVSVMCEALCEIEKSLLVRWETLGWFPKPMYKVPSSSSIVTATRWYSAEQIVNLNRFLFFTIGPYHRFWTDDPSHERQRLLKSSRKTAMAVAYNNPQLVMLPPELRPKVVTPKGGVVNDLKDTPFFQGVRALFYQREIVYNEKGERID